MRILRLCCSLSLWHESPSTQLSTWLPCHSKHAHSLIGIPDMTSCLQATSKIDIGLAKASCLSHARRSIKSQTPAASQWPRWQVFDHVTVHQSKHKDIWLKGKVWQCSMCWALAEQLTHSLACQHMHLCVHSCVKHATSGSALVCNMCSAIQLW